MKIYIDFDDCLCETTRHFSGLVYEMFGKKVPYEAICFFDLHGLKAARLYCLDKYGRDNFIKNSTFSLKLDDYYKMHFDYGYGCLGNLV